jgi:hypothetical protein
MEKFDALYEDFLDKIYRDILHCMKKDKIFTHFLKNILIF